jgi:hypothetical protein
MLFLAVMPMQPSGIDVQSAANAVRLIKQAQSATVWDLGGQPASYSGKEYSRLFKEIMGVLK